MDLRSKKHAICVVAHKNWGQLKDLIETISTSLTDVYLHVDKKSRSSFDAWLKENKLCIKGEFYIIDSRSVDWGGYSQLLVELDLFNEVIKNKDKYSYVHLISQVKTFL